VPNLSAECTYCLEKCDPAFMICIECWKCLCGELQDRVISARAHKGPDSLEFANAVRGGLKFLIWLDEDDE
jgi:hypothetical protein